MPRLPTVINLANAANNTYSQQLKQQQQQTKAAAAAYLWLNTATAAIPANVNRAAAAIQQSQQVQSKSWTALNASMRQVSVSTVAASAAVGAAMLGFEKHFSPSTWHRFELRVGDFAAVMGEVLHPAFVKLSDTVYNVSKWILNLSPATKRFVADIATIAVPLIVGTTLFAGLATVMRSTFNIIKTGITLLGGMKLFGSIGAVAPVPSVTGVMHVSATGVVVTGGIVNGVAGVAAGATAAAVSGTAATGAAVAGTAAAAAGATAAGRGFIGTVAGWLGTGARFLFKKLAWVFVADLADTLLGSPVKNWIGSLWSGGPDTKRTEDQDPTNRDAFRQVKTMNSVLDAGQMFRERSLFYTDKNAPDENAKGGKFYYPKGAERRLEQLKLRREAADMDTSGGLGNPIDAIKVLMEDFMNWYKSDATRQRVS